jgi:hypothetical protein
MTFQKIAAIQAPNRGKLRVEIPAIKCDRPQKERLIQDDISIVALWTITP